MLWQELIRRVSQPEDVFSNRTLENKAVFRKFRACHRVPTDVSCRHVS